MVGKLGYYLNILPVPIWGVLMMMLGLFIVDPDGFITFIKSDMSGTINDIVLTFRVVGGFTLMFVGMIVILFGISRWGVENGG